MTGQRRDQSVQGYERDGGARGLFRGEIRDAIRLFTIGPPSPSLACSDAISGIEALSAARCKKMPAPR